MLVVNQEGTVVVDTTGAQFKVIHSGNTKQEYQIVYSCGGNRSETVMGSYYDSEEAQDALLSTLQLKGNMVRFPEAYKHEQSIDVGEPGEMCPVCGGDSTVYDTRYDAGSGRRVRRRICSECHNRWKTVEIIV